MFDRRQVVTGFGAAFGALGAAPLSKAWAAASGAVPERGDTRLVVVNLHGGMDGLAALAPYGDPLYRKLRPGLALPAPGSGDGATLKADGLFAFHPRLKNLHALFGRGEALPVQSVASPYHTRSHFEAQDVLANGSVSPRLRTGWLNRALTVLPGSDTGARPAVSVGGLMPLMLRGEGHATSWSPFGSAKADDRFGATLGDLYGGDPLFARLWSDAAAAGVLAKRAGLDGTMQKQPDRFGEFMGMAAAMLNTNQGLRVVSLDTQGWDTHADQGALEGDLPALFGELDEGLGAFQARLDPALWRRTVVVLVTEFGRAVRSNGTRGTDHGTAGLVLLLGGAVRGGRIAGDWRGLKERDLYEARDLFPAVDMRAVLKSVLGDHMGIASAALDDHVFPDSRGAEPLDGLIA